MRLHQDRHGLRWALTKKTKERFKNRVRDLTGRNCGRSIKEVISVLRRYLLGWHGYFQITSTPSVLLDFDRWIRHRLRCLMVKQRQPGGHQKWWALALAANTEIPNRYFDHAGLPRLVEA